MLIVVVLLVIVVVVFVNIVVIIIGVDVDAEARLAMASDMGNIGNEVLSCLARCDLVDLRLNRTGLTSR